MTCNADNVAKDILANIIGNQGFDLPDIDFSDDAWKLPDSLEQAISADVASLTIEELTQKLVNGNGTFDVMMTSMKVHLKEEFSAGRITGAEYSKTYIALATSALQSGLQFLLQKDITHWQAITAQLNAFSAKITLETNKAQYLAAKAAALTAKADFALTTMKLATEDAQYCNMLADKARIIAGTELTTQQKNNLVAEAVNIPKQGAILDSQKQGLDTQNQIASYNLTTTLPKQTELLVEQIEGQEKTNSIAQFNLTSMLPQQLLLNKEQTEAARAQTLDTRTDGEIVVGSVGKQKDLYNQQITSYQRSSEINAAKLYADAWIAHKSIDEAIDTPASFNASTISQVLSTVKTNNNL